MIVNDQLIKFLKEIVGAPVR